MFQVHLAATAFPRTETNKKKKKKKKKRVMMIKKKKKKKKKWTVECQRAEPKGFVAAVILSAANGAVRCRVFFFFFFCNFTTPINI